MVGKPSRGFVPKELNNLDRKGNNDKPELTQFQRNLMLNSDQHQKNDIKYDPTKINQNFMDTTKKIIENSKEKGNINEKIIEIIDSIGTANTYTQAMSEDYMLLPTMVSIEIESNTKWDLYFTPNQLREFIRKNVDGHREATTDKLYEPQESKKESKLTGEIRRLDDEIKTISKNLGRQENSARGILNNIQKNRDEGKLLTHGLYEIAENLELHLKKATQFDQKVKEKYNNPINELKEKYKNLKEKDENLKKRQSHLELLKYEDPINAADNKLEEKYENLKKYRSHLKSLKEKHENLKEYRSRLELLEHKDPISDTDKEEIDNIKQQDKADRKYIYDIYKQYKVKEANKEDIGDKKRDKEYKEYKKIIDDIYKQYNEYNEYLEITDNIHKKCKKCKEEINNIKEQYKKKIDGIYEPYSKKIDGIYEQDEAVIGYFNRKEELQKELQKELQNIQNEYKNTDHEYSKKIANLHQTAQKTKIEIDKLNDQIDKKNHERCLAQSDQISSFDEEIKTLKENLNHATTTLQTTISQIQDFPASELDRIETEKNENIVKARRRFERKIKQEEENFYVPLLMERCNLLDKHAYDLKRIYENLKLAEEPVRMMSERIRNYQDRISSIEQNQPGSQLREDLSNPNNPVALALDNLEAVWQNTLYLESTSELNRNIKTVTSYIESVIRAAEDQRDGVIIQERINTLITSNEALGRIIKADIEGISQRQNENTG